jgi:hypothetical protein
MAASVRAEADQLTALTDFEICWIDRGHPPRNQPNPHYPDGCHVDLTGSHPVKLTHPKLPESKHQTCRIELPYPSGHDNVGTWVLVCRRCKRSLAITAASRVDDARSVLVSCKS